MLRVSQELVKMEGMPAKRKLENKVGIGDGPSSKKRDRSLIFDVG